MERNSWKWLLMCLLTVFLTACSDKDDPIPEVDEDNLVSATPAGTRSAVELQLLISLTGRNIDPALFAYDVDIYQVVYKTVYKDQEIDASGLILLPRTSVPLPMLSFQHGTIVQQADAPSLQSHESLEILSYAAMASMGFITVIPDMIGFGESQDIFHPYYVEEPTATAVVHNLLAARTLADDEAVSFDNRLFLAGYSQGGYATMATHKALEDDSHDFELIASFPAAGGYDIKAMQEYFFSVDTYPQPYYLAYVGRSYETYYDQPSLLTDFFNDPYATNIPSLFDGINSSSQINAQLTDDIQALVREDIRTNINTAAQYEYIKDAFEENSLVDWAPTLPMYMYHGNADETVPYENSELTYTKLINNGATTDNLQLITLPGADHTTGIEPYIEDVIKKLETLR